MADRVPIVFISTTWRKFCRAESVNDLYDDSGLEDRLWRALKLMRVPAERQWLTGGNRERYFLDIAVFCHRGNVAIEADGHEWHSGAERVDADNVRSNTIVTKGWDLVRFSESQILDDMRYCLRTILENVNRLGGPDRGATAGSRYVGDGSGWARQMALFEERTPYDAESPID